MEYFSPPPTPKLDEKKPKEKFRKVQLKGQEKRNIIIQKAQVRDVEEILELINGFADKRFKLFLPGWHKVPGGDP